MADEVKNTAATANATQAGTKAPRKRREGPAPTRPAYLIYKITDSAGNPIADAQLQVSTATRKSDEILAALDNDRSLNYAKFEI